MPRLAGLEPLRALPALAASPLIALAHSMSDAAGRGGKGWTVGAESAVTRELPEWCKCTQIIVRLHKSSKHGGAVARAEPTGMRSHFPGHSVHGFKSPIPQFVGRTDPKDEHVAAAALKRR